MVPSVPTRRVSDDEIEAFWRDGAVCLRGVISPEWIERMRAAVERALVDEVTTTDLSALGADLAQVGASVLNDPIVAAAGAPRGQFRAGTDHWKRDPDFAAFAQHSPLPHLVAQLLRSERVNLYEDSVLAKEPGTVERTAFHQDMAYFHVEGQQVCTTWAPLDPVTLTNGSLQFVAGSHLSKQELRPNFFVTTMAMPDTEGDEVPDYFAAEHRTDDRGRRLLCWDLEPGDITVHQARTIHGAEGNPSRTQRRRAISVRYIGDDARFHLRRGAPQKPYQSTLAEGDVIDHPDAPQVWPPSTQG
jgi:ectoine hydroxylase-related dioxygenase (phytanoyl-CoA dioxygenase family)